MDFKKLLAGGLLAAASLASYSASALTIPFAINGGWVLGTETQTAGINPVSFHEADGTVANTYHELRWGTPLPGSGLRLDNAAPGFISSDGVPVLLSTLTHFNNVISAMSATLTGVVLRSQLDLNFGDVVDTTDFTITFKETPNNGSCAPPNPNGTNCDDIFELIGGLPTVSFVIGMQTFELELFLVAGPGAAIVDGKIYTREPGTSQLFTFARLTQIPEPGSLALLGLGLLGFRAARRRA